MFGLFSDYKTTEEIELKFAEKRLKAHYTLYASLIGLWEENILESIGSLGRDDPPVGDWLEAWQAPEWAVPQMAQEMDAIEAVGLEERILELEEKLKEVEVGLGNRMIKKKYAEKEMAICTNAAQIVKQSEQNVKTLRRKLRKYPKRLGMLNQKVGSKLLRRRRMYDVIDILELILPSNLLAASSKKQMVKLIKEQDWFNLEPTRFLNINAIRQGIGSLKSKIIHFDKEIRDEFCQQLQKPNFDTFKNLFEFLHGMPECKNRWELCHRKYSKHFKDELDALFELLSSPRNYIEQSVVRLIGLWFSSLNFFDQDRLLSSPNQRPSVLRPRRSIMIESSVVIACLISIADNLRQSMANWNRLIKFTFLHENNLKQKVTDESENLAFTQQIRDALFLAKYKFLQMSFENLESQIVKLKEDQLNRLALKHILQLRISVATFYHEAQAFSFTLPNNNLEKEFENLVDVFFDQNFSSQFELLIAMIRTTDVELITLDYSNLSKQVREVLMHIEEVSSLKTYPFANKKLSYDSLFKNLRELIEPALNSLEFSDLRERVDKLKDLNNQQKGYPLSQALDEPKNKLINLLTREAMLSHFKLDYTSSALSSVIITYYKHWVYFPEYSDKIKDRLESLQQLNYLFNLLKMVSPVTVQFVLSGGFNLHEITSEDQFNQLENFHDIVLFQHRFKNLRKSMKALDSFLDSSLVTGFKEKLTNSIADILVLANAKIDPKDKLTLSLERAIKTVLAFESIDNLELTTNHSEEIYEIEDLVFYHLLLNQTKDQQVFNKISKIKWDDLKDATLVSDYAMEIVGVIKNICGIISKIGKNLLIRNRSQHQRGKTWTNTLPCSPILHILYS
jgi:hypothetical protein